MRERGPYIYQRVMEGTSMNKYTNFAVASLMALAVSTAATPSQARIVASATNASNFSFTAATALVPINAGATSIVFNSNNTGQAVVTFSAECAVNAATGANAAWVDIDILRNGAAISPTSGSGDAFCTANGTAGFDGWVRASITLVVPLVIGNNTITIQGRLNNGATGGWISDSAIVVER